VTPALTLSGVACLRGDRLLFEGLDLALAAGEAALVTGPNGAGKSSLLRIAAGLLRPSAGRITRDGGIALAAEAAGLEERLPLARALGFWAALDGTAPETLDDALTAMGIADLAIVPIRLFSTGQRKRAVLARTIASGAGIWLLDEPGNGLDNAGLALLEAAIAAHRARGGIVVAATHQPLALADARALAL
jgi:heme exporter protein A